MRQLRCEDCKDFLGAEMQTRVAPESARGTEFTFRFSQCTSHLQDLQNM